MRETTAALLGFDGVMQNTLDAVASRDFAVEMLAALALAATTISRLAQDFYNWATPEFNYIEVDDSLAVCSSIMPQKKNPVTLESVKAKAAHIEGFWIGVYNGLKNSIFTLSRDITESLRYFRQALQETEASMVLMTATVKTLSVKKDRMAAAARENFCTVTELANYLVRYDGYSFRAAHDIVALVVDHMIGRGKKASEIHRGELNAICRQLFSRETSLTDEQIARALDPALNARSKKALGGPAPEEVTRQLNALEKTIGADADTLAARRDQVRRAKETLEKRLDELIA
jgi:argininosuccinate lyase